MEFGGVLNTVGLYAFLSIIPLIILYLIKPKPKVLKIPTLQFFIKNPGTRQKYSFFQRFVRDYLFLIQLLTLIMLSAAIAVPYIYISQKTVASHTVIVIDVSASSQAKEGTQTRFEIAKEKAKDYLSRRNTIILAKDVPLVGLEEGSRRDAEDFLRTLKPADTISKIGEAMSLAGEALQGREGRIFVFSDFINTEGTSPEIAQSVLKSRGATAELIKIGESKNNVGFVGLDVEDDTAVAYIKNYNPREEKVKLTIGSFEKDLTLKANGADTFIFQTPRGVSKLELNANDDFPLDNEVIVSAPEGDKIKVLLISNGASNFLKFALTSANIVDLTVAEPPIVPKGDFDIYITQDIDPEELLAGTLKDIEKKVENGASLIVHNQEKINELDFDDLLPVLNEGRGAKGNVIVDQTTEFTRDLEFSPVNGYMKTRLKPKAISIASVHNFSLIALQELKDGKVVYYGIEEKNSDFKITPSYPIFWTNLIKFLSGQTDIRRLNMKTGDTIILENRKMVVTPEGPETTNIVMLDHQGVYQIDGRKIGVNLLSREESNIDPASSTTAKMKRHQLEGIDEDVEMPLDMYALLIALALVLLEIIYVKVRGDL